MTPQERRGRCLSAPGLPSPLAFGGERVSPPGSVKSLVGRFEEVGREETARSGGSSGRGRRNTIVVLQDPKPVVVEAEEEGDGDTSMMDVSFVGKGGDSVAALGDELVEGPRKEKNGRRKSWFAWA